MFFAAAAVSPRLLSYTQLGVHFLVWPGGARSGPQNGLLQGKLSAVDCYYWCQIYGSSNGRMSRPIGPPIITRACLINPSPRIRGQFVIQYNPLARPAREQVTNPPVWPWRARLGVPIWRIVEAERKYFRIVLSGERARLRKGFIFLGFDCGRLFLGDWGCLVYVGRIKSMVVDVLFCFFELDY